MSKDSKTLDKLRELTENLPPIPDLGAFKEPNEYQPGCVSYKVEGGHSLSYALLSLPGISVARTLVTSGAKFPEHQHDEKEVIVVFSGRAMMTVGDEKIIMNEGDCMMFEPNVPHSARALEDVWFIAISVPYSKDYPDARTEI